MSVRTEDEDYFDDDLVGDEDEGAEDETSGSLGEEDNR